MGLYFLDQYSILHFATGVITYFWSISFFTVVFIHILFEYIENTQIGMKIINRYFIGWWPGGKTHPDSILNRISDTLFTAAGWIVSQQLDKLYREAS
jgi:hypothetical protein